MSARARPGLLLTARVTGAPIGGKTVWPPRGIMELDPGALAAKDPTGPRVRRPEWVNRAPWGSNFIQLGVSCALALGGWPQIVPVRSTRISVGGASACLRAPERSAARRVLPYVRRGAASPPHRYSRGSDRSDDSQDSEFGARLSNRPR
jgi:hypothetical protein